MVRYQSAVTISLNYFFYVFVLFGHSENQSESVSWYLTATDNCQKIMRHFCFVKCTLVVLHSIDIEEEVAGKRDILFT